MVAILAVSIGLALIMLTVNGAFRDRLDQIRAEIGTEVTVRPAGSFGFMGGGEPLLEKDVARIETIPGVVSVERALMVRYSGDSLQSAIEPGTLGGRFFGGQGGGGTRPAPSPSVQDFRVPITVMGADTSGSLQVFGGGQADVVSGRGFTKEDSDANVAILGEALAEKNNLAVGSTLDLEGTPVEVIGLFTSGQRFGDNTVFMPIDSVRRLFGLADEVSSATVRVDSIGNVDRVATAIKATLGEDRVDVVTSTQTFARISAPVADAENSSQTAMLAALGASAAIILFSIVLVVRQRVKEIGILKAIGASNWQIGLQFGIETLVVSVGAAIIGALVTFPAAQTVANSLVSEPTGPGGPGGGPRIFAAPAGAGGFLGDVDVAVSPQVFLYALGIALGLAVLASVVPSWYVANVRPAEVLRHE